MCPYKFMLAYNLRVDWHAPGVTFRSVRSPGGHTPDELKSAMQKYIRRGSAPMAAYCARELCALSMSELRSIVGRSSRTLAIATNTIHRMMIICSEDIGPAMGPTDWEYVRDQIEWMLKTRRKCIQSYEDGDTQRDHYCELAAFLALLPKTRIISHIRSATLAWRDPSVLREAVETGAPLAPDLMPAALLHASAKYSRVCELVETARDEPSDADGVAHARAVVEIARAFLSERNETTGDYAEWTKELCNSRELFLVRMMAAAHRATFAMNSRDAADTARDRARAKRIVREMTFDAREFDDFVYDKHTSRGRRSNPAQRGALGALTFALEGARIEHEDPSWALRDFADFYIDKKTVEAHRDLASVRASFTPFIDLAGIIPQPYESEESAWKFEVRAQLVTSMAHTDTYFATTAQHHQWLFIKGPVPIQVARDAVAISMIKRAICGDLPVIDLSVAQCARLDSHALHSPLGLRAHWDPHVPAGFIVARALRGSARLARMMRASTCWPQTEVIDWSANASQVARVLSGGDSNVQSADARSEAPASGPGPIALSTEIMRTVARESPVALRDFRLSCYFRFALGVRDNAARNFILRDDARIVACDEDNFDCNNGMTIANEWIAFIAKFPATLADLLVARDETNMDAISLAEWRERLFILRANYIFARDPDEWSRRFARVDARLEYVISQVRSA